MFGETSSTLSAVAPQTPSASPCGASWAANLGGGNVGLGTLPSGLVNASLPRMPSTGIGFEGVATRAESQLGQHWHPPAVGPGSTGLLGLSGSACSSSFAGAVPPPLSCGSSSPAHAALVPQVNHPTSTGSLIAPGANSLEHEDHLVREAGARRRQMTDFAASPSVSEPVANASFSAVNYGSCRAIDRVVGVVGGGLPTDYTQQALPPERGALVFASPGSGNASDISANLQKRLGADVADREACQFALVKVKRIVAFFRQQVQAATENRGSFDPLIQHLRELADALDAEVRSVSSVAGGGLNLSPEHTYKTIMQDSSTRGSVGCSSPGRGSYDVLRQSLHDAQRRCESLTAELSRQTQASEELVLSVNAAKDTNKKLTEQVRQQSEEIAALARQRVVDEERIEDLRRRQRHDEELREKDAQRRITEATLAMSVRHQDEQHVSATKLRRLRAGMELVLRELGRLRADNVEQRQGVTNVGESMRHFIQQTERSLVRKAELITKRHLELQLSTTDVTRDLEMRVVAEHEMRVNEASTWSHRHALLSAERDDLQARMTRDVTQLTAQLQAAERGREEERRTWAEEKSNHLRRSDELVQQQVSCEAQSEQLKQTLTKAEAANATLEKEKVGNATAHATALADLQRQLREVNEALGNAESAKDNLKQQLEEQRRRLMEAGDSAVASCRDVYEQRLAAFSEESKTNLTKVNERMRQAEENLISSEAALEHAKTRAAGAAEDASALRRDLERSKIEVDDVNAVRKNLESDLLTSRRELVDERARLQAMVDRLELQRTALEGETQAWEAKLAESAKNSADRESTESKRIATLEASVHDRDVRLEDREKRLVETRDAAAESNAETVLLRQRALDLQASLDNAVREASEERRRLEEERRKLEDTVTSQAKTAHEHQEQYEKWRQSHMTTLQQLQDENAARVAALDREKESCQAELIDAREKMTGTEVRLQAAERELTRVRHLLNESQSSMSDLRSETAREQQDANAAKLQLEEEVKQISAALETALQNESSLTQRLDEATARHRQQQQKLENELEDSRKQGTSQLSDREQRLERLRIEYESRIQSMEARYSTEQERERVQIDSVVRENEQLRRFLSEQKKNSTLSMASLQSQLETHIHRLQQHTSELRGDLTRSETLPLTSLGQLQMVAASPTRCGSSPVLGSASTSGLGSCGGAMGGLAANAGSSPHVGITPLLAAPPSIGGPGVAEMPASPVTSARRRGRLE